MFALIALVERGKNWERETAREVHMTKFPGCHLQLAAVVITIALILGVQVLSFDTIMMRRIQYTLVLKEGRSLQGRAARLAPLWLYSAADL
jgi:hypothetical protein